MIRIGRKAIGKSLFFKNCESVTKKIVTPFWAMKSFAYD